jgi:glutathione S-transferase
MIRIWGRKNSINVQKVMWAVGEIGLKHERIDAGGAFGKTKDPDFLKMNPNSLVPVLQDGDLTLWESNAIVRYLAARYGDDGMWPEDPAPRAKSDMWMDWMTTTINPAIFPTFWGLIRTPAEQRDMKAIEAARVKTADLLKIFESHMAHRLFVGGTNFSIGDVAMGVFVKRWFALPIERPKLPALQAYYDRLKQRPAFIEHVESIPLT